MRMLIPACMAFVLLLSHQGFCHALVKQSTDSGTTESGEKSDKEKPDEEKRKPGEVVTTTVAEGLNNPFSISIESDRIFVAESGAGRIVEIKDGKAVEVADGFPPKQFRGYKAGPLGLDAVGENVLLVGHDNESGVGSITKLTLKDNDKDPALTDVVRETVSIEGTSGKKLDQISNLVVKHSVVYAVTHGDEENGWIALAEIQKGKLKSLRPSIPTAKRSRYRGPTCATVSPDGEYLVVSQMGSDGEAKDSRLVFYTLQGKLLRNFEVELHDIVALAYSPNRKHLFAIDYSYADPSKGALYKLIGKEADKCAVKKLQDLKYATAMEFDSAGNLYVLSLGGPPNPEKPAGKLIRIAGLDDMPGESDDPQDEEQ